MNFSFVEWPWDTATKVSQKTYWIGNERPLKIGSRKLTERVPLSRLKNMKSAVSAISIKEAEKSMQVDEFLRKNNTIGMKVVYNV